MKIERNNNTKAVLDMALMSKFGIVGLTKDVDGNEVVFDILDILKDGVLDKNMKFHSFETGDLIIIDLQGNMTYPIYYVMKHGYFVDYKDNVFITKYSSVQEEHLKHISVLLD